MAPSLHPLIDNGITKGQSNFGGGTLRCHCKSNPVEVEIKGDVLHNHACGCSQCWKPNGALFSVVAVTPDDNVKVTKNKDKLAVQNPDATILRTACKECGVHMYGPIEKDHAFKGLSFVHVELSDSKGWQEPQFAGFVPSLAEQDSSVNLDEVRQRLKDIGLESYDALNPPLMEALQKFEEEKSGKKGKL